KGNGRLVLFDPKGEWPSKLFARLPAGAALYLNHPLDSRSVAWDMAADIRTPADVHQLSSMVVPESNQEHNRYFTDSARDIVRTVLLVLGHFAPDAWTLRDLMCFANNLRLLEALFKLHPI